MSLSDQVHRVYGNNIEPLDTTNEYHDFNSYLIKDSYLRLRTSVDTYYYYCAKGFTWHPVLKESLPTKVKTLLLLNGLYT